MSTQKPSDRQPRPRHARAGLRKLGAGLAVIATVLLQTAASPRAVAEPRPAHFVDRGGPVLQAAQIYLLYWGTAWTNTGTSSPTPDQITAEFRWVVTGPYLTGLAEYRDIQPATLRAATVVRTSDPPSGFDDHAVRDFLDTQLDTGVVPEPGADNQTLYFVLVPPGVPSGGDSSEFNGEHYYFTRHHQRIHFAWTVDTGSIAASTGVLSHELVESLTDPEGNAITGLAGILPRGRMVRDRRRLQRHQQRQRRNSHHVLVATRTRVHRPRPGQHHSAVTAVPRNDIQALPNPNIPCADQASPSYRSIRVDRSDALVLRVGRRRVSGEESRALGDGGGLHPGGHVKLAQDVGHMHAGRLAADKQRGTDLAVGAAFANQP
jgi:hypothetical protein